MFERVREVLRLEFDLPDDAIRPSARLADDLDLDSVDTAELLLLLEEATGLTFPEDDLRSLETVQHVVDLVASRLARA